MGRLQHKYNQLQLLATCSITNKQNHNVIDYTESDHYYVCLKTSSERKQTPFAWFDWSIVRQRMILMNAIYEITNL